MALIQVNFVSETLVRTVPIQVILPVDKLTLPGQPPLPERQFPTLYLLHGVFGNYTDWVSGTMIQRWAEEKDLAVVMPSGDNMFYVDQEKAHNYYGEFIGKELVDITRKMFPLSRKREDTFIAGLSMGGYGALRNGLKYHDTFGYVAGLSSALVTYGIEDRTDESPMFIETRSFAESIFGDLSKVKESDKNPEWLLRKLVKEGVDLPKFFMCCGTEDSLLPLNRKLRDVFRELGVDLTYEEGPGVHDWVFWNTYIKKVIDWLPLKQAASGVDSGHVGI